MRQWLKWGFSQCKPTATHLPVCEQEVGVGVLQLTLRNTFTPPWLPVAKPRPSPDICDGVDTFALATCITEHLSTAEETPLVPPLQGVTSWGHSRVHTSFICCVIFAFRAQEVTVIKVVPTFITCACGTLAAIKHGQPGHQDTGHAVPMTQDTTHKKCH